MARKQRYKLWKANPHCHWCGLKTVFNTKFKKNPKLATIDHVFSKFHPERFTLAGTQQKVLACSKCNSERSRKECMALSHEERRLRGRDGFALNKGPDGKKIITKPLNTLEEVLDVFAKYGIVLDNEERQPECSEMA